MQLHITRIHNYTMILCTNLTHRIIPIVAVCFGAEFVMESMFDCMISKCDALKYPVGVVWHTDMGYDKKHDPMA